MNDLPVKPPFASPCNGCGLCCQLELCVVGKLMFPLEEAPCPALVKRDGRTFCAVVLMEKQTGVDPLVARTLGIGHGCSMADPETTDEEIAAFDLECENSGKT